MPLKPIGDAAFNEKSRLCAEYADFRLGLDFQGDLNLVDDQTANCLLQWPFKLAKR